MSNKLELTWIEKYKTSNIEQRILLENKLLSNKNKNENDTENMLIHGDNLLALKALENNYSGKIKCIYIDPPFNTGAAFEYYDDNLEHSIWLDLMYKRIQILYKLLSEEGAIVVHLDDSEVHYFKVIMDEVFGRSNFISTIAVRSSTPSGVKTTHKNKTIIKQKDWLVVYRKSDKLRITPQYVKKERWDSHYSYYLDRKNGKITNLVEKLLEDKIIEKKVKLEDLDVEDDKFKNYYLKNRFNIFRTQPTMPNDIKLKSKENPNELIEYIDNNGETNYAINGNRCNFIDTQIHTLNDGSESLSVLLCDIWTDIDFQNTQNEGNNSFPGGKKPERLIRRILNMFTEEGDFVLDSFLGSGTTCAVAHKMNRKWIGIELGEHCYSHCIPRLNDVINGNDDGGISKIVNWKGGGGYKFYELAPTLINIDQLGEPVINKEYNPEMLAAAVALHEGFKYNPSNEKFWKQSKGNENSYLYVTTKFVNKDMVNNIKEDMKDDEYLVIACTSYENAAMDSYKNIKIKKIPEMLLNKCQFGIDNYNLNIINPPEYGEEE